MEIFPLNGSRIRSLFGNNMTKLKIGVLGCGYDCVDDLDARLAPWFQVEQKHEIVFSFVSARFSEYKDLNLNVDNTPTLQKLFKYVSDGKLDYLEVPKDACSEHDARSLALRHLLATKCDLIWLLDLSDEYYTVAQIENILRFVDLNPYSVYFRIPFKNYILDGKQWVEGFCPQRIFRRETPNLLLDNFFWDNDAAYRHKSTLSIADGGTYDGPIEGTPVGTFSRDNQIAGSSVPSCILNEGIKHMTWLHSNGKNKVAYQLKHFGHCSYKWNSTENKLEIDYDFYAKTGVPLPIIRHD